VSIVEVVLALTVLLDRLKGLIMQNIGTPLQCEQLKLSPEREGNLKLSDDMQQSLALLAGFSKNQRIIIESSPVGALRVTSARIIDVKHFTATADNQTQQGDNVPCSEVMCMGHPDNTGKVWVRTLADATINNSWPLGAGETMSMSVDNFRDLQMLIALDTEKLIVAYA